MPILFPPLLLDDGRPGNMQIPDLDHVGRIWNIFNVDDLAGFRVEAGTRLPIFRIFDLDLLPALLARGLSNCPVILSHLIDLRGIPPPDWPAGLALEIGNKNGLLQANRIKCDLVIGRSFEVPGPSRECSAFLLFQLLGSESRHPFFIHGNTGYELFQAYLAQGVGGIVLPEDQFNRDTGAETFRFPLDSGASLRLRVKGGAPEAVGLRARFQANAPAFLAESFAEGLWSGQADDLLSHGNRPFLEEYLQLFELSPRDHTPVPSFYRDSPAARRLKCALPIVQGPMANITVTPSFASAVYEAGALPCLALAGLSTAQACALLKETAALDIPFGAGIVSVSENDAALERIIECLEANRPTLVVLAAPQLDHVQRLLRTDLNLAVHAPNGTMFRALFDMGVRTFIIEGEEAGGHVSRIGSLSAWQEVLNEVRTRRIQNEVHLILAGGIYNDRSARLITQLLDFSGMAGELAVSLQMGTAYLATHEALSLTPLPATYQKLLFSLDETIVTGETLHRNVRQLATPATTDLLAREWSIFTSHIDLSEKKDAYERLYQGAHRRAITSPEHDPLASYMAGAVAILIDKPLSLMALHQALITDVRPDAPALRHEPIAIVGVGVLIPGADSLEEHFYNLLMKRCFIRDMPDDRFKRSDYLTDDPDDRSRSYSGLAGLIGELDKDLSMFRIPPRVAKELAGFQIIALRCAHRALTDAGFFRRPIPSGKVATFVGVNGNTSQPPTERMLLWIKARERLLALPEVDAEMAEGLEALFKHYESLYQDEWTYTEDTRTGKLASIVASRIANVFDLGGITNTLDAACASGLAAIAQAVSMLNDRRCDVALAGAVGPEMSPDTFVSFASLKALSAKGSFPFDARADGFVMGEGGGTLVLKRESDALRHGDRIYALIHGWGASSDGAGKGITAPNYKGQRIALNEAYSRVAIDPLDLDFLECHATGTPVGDHEERLAVHGFFGEPRRKLGKPPLPIGGSKAVTGHLLSGAGVVSTLSALFAINLRRVPPQVNFEQAPPDIDLASLGLKVATRPEVIHSPVVHAGVSSFGFGGVNYHIVLSSPRSNARAPLLDPAIAEFPRFGNLTGDTLFLFPGQGSQHPGMLHAFRDDPKTRDFLTRAESLFSEFSDAPLVDLLLVDPTLNEDQLRPYNDLLKSTRISQPAIFLTSAVFLEKLRERDIPSAMAIGHSLGEHSAIYAAGMLGFDDSFRMVCIRGQLMSTRRGDEPGAMVALYCGERQARELLANIKGYTTCANFNSYNQTVISGETSAIAELMEIAESRGIRAFRLMVERGFHSRLVADCETPMVSALADCDWRYGTIPVLANRSRQAYPHHAAISGQRMSAQDRADALALLAGLIPSPVDFIAQVNAAYESGIRRFVEVGPKNILTRLVDQILQGKPFQTESLQHPTEPVTVRIDTLGERLRAPLSIKRQPLPTHQVAHKEKKREDAATDAPTNPVEVIRAAVAEVSGYARDQVRDDAEFERDLGIDTLKIFEILSRLRGTILPQQVENFRQLTSVSKILTAANAARQNVSAQKSGDAASSTRAIHCYHYRTTTSGSLATTSAAPPQGMLLVERLPSTLGSIARELLPRLHRLLRDHGNTPVESRPPAINLITYGPKAEFYDGAFLALTAYFRCARQDIPDTVFTYTHFDGLEPSSAMIAAALSEPRIGRRILTDGRILEGQLCLIDELFGERDRLADLLTEKDVVLVTGGARGITAEITKDLIQRTRARFLILARQPRTEPWIEAFGQERIRYLAADLLDAPAIDALRLGQYGITLMIHGAGIEISKNLTNKSDEEFASVLGIKAGGLERILTQLDPATLRGVVQFSSVVSYVGNNGQADYAAANGILNGSLPWGIPALSIAWSAWDEVGMATRGLVKEIFQTRGVKMIPLGAGIEVFERMLAGFLATPPKGTLCAAVFGATDGYQSTSEVLLPSPPPTPLGDYRLSDPEGLLDLEVAIDLERHSLLKDHSFDGKVVTPACVMMRQFIAAALAESGQASDLTIKFEATEFLLPLQLRDGQTSRLHLTRRDNAFTIDQMDGDRTLPVMRTRMVLLGADSQATEDSLQIARELQSLAVARPTPFDIADTPVTADFGLSSFGPAFNVLSQVAYNGMVIRGEVDLAKADAADGTLMTDTGRVGFLIESAFLCCTRWFYLNVTDDQFRLPKAIESCTVFPQRCAEARTATVYSIYHDAAESAYFDCVVVDEHNRPLLVLKNYQVGVPGNLSSLMRRPLAMSTPLRLGEAQLLILDLPKAVGWGLENTFMTSQEADEVVALTSLKRQHERLAGKLSAKLLARNGTDAWRPSETAALMHYQVLSDNSPVRLTYDGKPLSGRPYFSISHTDDLVCAARADAPVGVDVERVRSLPEKTVHDICGTELIRKIDTYLDQEWLSTDDRAALAKAMPVLVFTQKEAVLKAAGIGLAKGLDDVHLEEIAINRETMASHRGLNYRVISTFNDAHVVSIAVADQPAAPGAPLSTPAQSVALSHFQEALCRNEHARTDGRNYTLTHRMRLRGALDVTALRQALDLLDQQHDVLRMGFGEDGSGFVRASTGVTLTVIKLDDLAHESARLRAESLARELAAKNYLLDREPLYRPLLLQLPENVSLLLLNFHHLIMDCFSSFDYANALMKTYRLVRQGGGPKSCNEDAPQYAGFVARQRDRLAPGRLAVLQRYWAQQLMGAPPVLLPVKQTAEPGVMHSDFRIDNQEYALIEAYCRRTGVTTFIGLLSALQAALLRWLKRSDMVVGIPFSLKDRASEAGMLGPFVNLLPIRGLATHRTTWVELSLMLRKALFDAIDHHDIPPLHLASICTVEADEQHRSARVICQLIYEPEGEKPLPELEVERSVFDGYDSEQALVFTFFRESSGLRCAVTRNTTLVSKDDVDLLVKSFFELVAHMYAYPDTAVPLPQP